MASLRQPSKGRANVAVPASKPPAVKGKHVVIVFPVANIKEQSVHVTSSAPLASDGSISTVTVSFDTFSPTKHYQKSIDLPEAVTLHHIKKDVTTKTMSVSLPLPSAIMNSSRAPERAAPEVSTADKATSVAAKQQLPQHDAEAGTPLEQGVGEECNEEAEAPAPQQPCHSDGSSHGGTPPPVQAPLPDEAAGPLPSNNDNSHSTAAAKRKRKKAKKSNSKDDDDDLLDAILQEEADEADVSPESALAAAQEELTAALAHLQEELNKSLRGDVQRRVEAAADAKKEAEERVAQVEAELKKAKQALVEANKQVQAAEAETRGSQSSLESAKKRAQDARNAVKSREASCKARQAAAEAEQRKVERQGSHGRSNSRRPPRTAEREAAVPVQNNTFSSGKHMKQPEVGKKEMAKKMEEALGASIAGSEELKAQLDKRIQESQSRQLFEEMRKSENGRSQHAAKSSKRGPLAGIRSEDVARVFGPSYDANPEEVSKSLEVLANDGSGNCTALLLLAQLREERGDAAGSGEVMLQFLAHPEADTVCDAKMRTDLATKAMALLKDHPDRLRKQLPLIGELASKYSILNMGYMLAGEASASAKKAPTAAARNEAAKPATKAKTVTSSAGEDTKPKLIEEVPMQAPPLPQAKGKQEATVESTAAPPPATQMAPTPARAKSERSAPMVEEVPDGWTLDKDDGVAAWVNDISLPDISLLSELDVEISTSSVRLTQASTGNLVANIPVPESADADAAAAKWSKKRKVLTVRMPLQS
mmetsp:Transcript_66878/g.160101  ORF Transcript_66878/g.160101 Transcript_66878/m.160101 type:complete len:764 (+) Transcript_66878:69-2360(+)